MWRFKNEILVIFSGVVGKSLKGHPSVFVSSDAGVIWREVIIIINLLYLIGQSLI